jgi:hypothetical protein
MTWRRLHWLLCLIAVVVAILRLASGNILGALLPIIMAVIFGSIAADYPLISRLQQIWRFLRKYIWD